MNPFWKPDSGLAGGLVFGVCLLVFTGFAYALGGETWAVGVLLGGLAYSCVAFCYSMRNL